jgi:hypothetical protein
MIESAYGSKSKTPGSFWLLVKEAPLPSRKKEVPANYPLREKSYDKTRCAFNRNASATRTNASAGRKKFL